MEERGTLSRHFWLSRGMARAIGVDLTAARRDGRLDEDAQALLIARCSACGHGAECTHWLARHGAGAEAPPAFCALRADLLKLVRRG